MADAAIAAADRPRRRRPNRAHVVGKPGRELTTVAWRISRQRVSKAPLINVLIAIGIVGVAGLVVLLPIVTRIPWLVSGVASGVVLAGGMAFSLWIALISDGSMTWRVGALGEFWTCEELRKLGGDWTVLNSLRVPEESGRECEIDHVAVGPTGVITVDTKLWPMKSRPLDAAASPDINAAARGAHHQAGVVRHILDASYRQRRCVPRSCSGGRTCCHPLNVC